MTGEQLSEIVELEIEGARLLRPKVHGDGRGFFLEVFREDWLDTRFVQGNHSRSRAGVLRGLHYHRLQSDAWYVMSGRAQMALVDLRARRERPPVVTLELSSDDPSVVLIPPGIAHGFYAITDLDLIYWVTHYFDGSDELSVAWNDERLAVPWKTADPILSGRDASAPPLDWDEVERLLAGRR